MNPADSRARRPSATRANSPTASHEGSVIKSVVVVVVLAAVIASAVFVASGDDARLPVRPAGTDSSASMPRQKADGGQHKQAAGQEPERRPGSVLQDPFQTGRSWSAGTATPSAETVYLDPASEAFRAAAQKAIDTINEVAVEPPMQLVQPAPPDPAAAF